MLLSMAWGGDAPLLPTSMMNEVLDDSFDMEVAFARVVRVFSTLDMCLTD